MPSSQPVWVSRGSSATRARPKSIRTGERPSISTLVGLMSRCSTPTRCTACSASASASAKCSRSAPVDRALLVDVVPQREAGDVAGHHERRRPVRVGVEDLGDPRAGDPSQRADLAGQPLARLLVAHDVRAQHLQRHPAAVRRLREVHDAHAALTEPREQPVVADADVGGGGGGHLAEFTRRRGASSRRCRRRGRTGCRRGPGGSPGSAVRPRCCPRPRRRSTSGCRPG